MIEYCLIINSKDRNIESFKNPLDFTVLFNSETSNIQKIYRNVKYIGFENVILPRFIQLNKFIMSNTDTSKNILIDFFNNNQIEINKQYNVDTFSIEICNINNTSINFTINQNNIISYEFLINTNIINIYKPVCMSSPGNNIQYILLNPCTNKYILNTKSKDIFRYVLPKLNIDSDLYLYNRKSYIVYKDSELIDMKRVTVQLLNSDHKQMVINNLDYNVNNNGEYSNPEYYLRHPLNPKYQIELFLNVGLYEK